MNDIVKRLVSKINIDPHFILDEVSEEDTLDFLNLDLSIKDYGDIIKFLFNKSDDVKLLILQKARALSEKDITFPIETMIEYQTTKQGKLDKKIGPTFKNAEIIEKNFPGLYIIFDKNDEVTNKWRLLIEDRNLIHQFKRSPLKEFVEEKLKIAFQEVFRLINDDIGEQSEEIYEFLTSYKNGFLEEQIKKLPDSIREKIDKKENLVKNEHHFEDCLVKKNEVGKSLGVIIPTTQNPSLKDILNGMIANQKFLDDFLIENPLNALVYILIKNRSITSNEINKIFSACNALSCEKKQFILNILMEGYNKLDNFEELFQVLVNNSQWYEVWENNNKENCIKNILNLNEDFKTILTFICENSLLDHDVQELVFTKMNEQYKEVSLSIILKELSKEFFELIGPYLRFIYSQKTNDEKSKMVNEVTEFILSNDVQIQKLINNEHEFDDFSYKLLAKLSQESTEQMKHERDSRQRALQDMNQQEVNIRIDTAKILRDFTEKFESRLSDYKKGIDIPKETMINELFAFHTQYRDALERLKIFPVVERYSLGIVDSFNPEIQKSSNLNIEKNQQCIISTLGMQIIDNKKMHIFCKSLVDPKEKE